MKQIKKLVVFVLTLAVVFSNFSFAAMDTQAAEKTTTNVYDSKKGVCYPSKIRVGINQQSNNCAEVYLANEGDYVASVKSNSPNLTVKLTKKYIYSGNYGTSAELNGQESPDFKASYQIDCLSTKKGTYTITVTVKNAKKKTVCTKKIKVYAEDYSSPIKSIKYAGTQFFYTHVTKKKSGKIQVAMNSGYKLQKIEIGTYGVGKTYEEYYPEPEYKTVKNKQKITLATSTKYSAGVDSYGGGSYSYSREYLCDYLYPVTFVRVTYKDMKLGITKTTEYQLFYQNQ